MNPKISVIVPVYKAEKYLHKCVDSILAQTFTDFEVLLVDDGSPDRCGEICDEYVAKDSRVRVFHQENGGVTSARRLGVENALGEWINFVDSDDTIPLDALNNMYGAAQKDKVDIVMCASLDYTAHPFLSKTVAIKGTMKSSEYIKAMLSFKCGSGPMCRLVKKTLFDTKSFAISREVTNNEDLIMNIKLALNANYISVYPGIVVYNYFVRPNSASHKKLSIHDWDLIFKHIEECLPDHYMHYLKMYVLGVIYGRRLGLVDYQSSYYYGLAARENFGTMSIYTLYQKALNKNYFWGSIIIKLSHRVCQLYKIWLFVSSKHKI